MEQEGEQQAERLWTRTFVVLMGVNFCSALSFYLIMVKITEFAVDTYGTPTSIAGLLISVFVIAALLTRLFFGGRIDAWGVKRSLFIGAAVNAVSMLLYLVPMGFIPLMVVRIAHGFGFAIMSGSAAAGAALIIPRSRYGEGIGYFSMMQALATGVGPFVAILITNVFGGYVPMFVCSAAVAVLAVLSLFLLDIPPRQQEAFEHDAPKHMHAGKGRGIGSLVQLSVLPLASTLLLVYVGYSGVLSFITLYAGERGLSDAVSVYFVVYAAIILVSRPPVGMRIDRKGENSTIYFCFVSLAVGFVMLAFADNAVLLLVSAAFIGFGIGAVQSIVQAVIARDTPPAELGKANSTFFMSMDLGSGVGPIVIGAVIPFIGYSGSYLVLAVAALVAGVLYHIVHGRKHPFRF